MKLSIKTWLKIEHCDRNLISVTRLISKTKTHPVNKFPNHVAWYIAPVCHTAEIL